MVSPKSFVLHPALYIQSRAPKADWVFSCPASHKAVSLSNSAPRPRTELLQLPSISRGAVDLQGHTEPGRIRADSCDCHTHTHTFFKGTQKLQFSSAGAGEGKAGERLTCGNSCVHCRPQSSLCTVAVLQMMQPRIAHSEDSPPGKSQNKQSFRGLCLHTPHPCTKPLSLEVKKACQGNTLDTELKITKYIHQVSVHKHTHTHIYMYTPQKKIDQLSLSGSRIWSAKIQAEPKQSTADSY